MTYKLHWIASKVYTNPFVMFGAHSLCARPNSVYTSINLRSKLNSLLKWIYFHVFFATVHNQNQNWSLVICPKTIIHQIVTMVNILLTFLFASLSDEILEAKYFPFELNPIKNEGKHGNGEIVPKLPPPLEPSSHACVSTRFNYPYLS